MKQKVIKALTSRPLCARKSITAAKSLLLGPLVLKPVSSHRQSIWMILNDINMDDILLFDWLPVLSIKPQDWADDTDGETVLKRMASIKDHIWQANNSLTVQKLLEILTKEIIAVPHGVLPSASLSAPESTT